jgi:hypothetical protein
MESWALASFTRADRNCPWLPHVCDAGKAVIVMRQKWFSWPFFFALLFCCQTVQGRVSIGIYYYPGWSPTMGVYKPDPWKVIKPYPEREPMLGWYRDDNMETVNQQLEWMADYGVDFVSFAWYWIGGRPSPETSVRAYLNAPARARVSYALLWANHFKSPESLAERNSIVEFWLVRHLQNPEYLQIEGKPVIFVFSNEFLKNQAKSIGMEPVKMLEHARQAARNFGLNGIYFVLCTEASDFWVKDFAVRAGFDALSAYNYHFGVEGNLHKATRPSHSFSELSADYQIQWKWILKNSALPYFVPMTSGWDKRPWGGSEDPLHDNSMSTPQEFEAHLRAGYTAITTNQSKTKGIGMLCCWNEYGEGSIIEPSKRYGFEYLQRIQKVFGKDKK